VARKQRTGLVKTRSPLLDDSGASKADLASADPQEFERSKIFSTAAPEIHQYLVDKNRNILFSFKIGLQSKLILFRKDRVFSAYVRVIITLSLGSYIIEYLTKKPDARSIIASGEGDLNKAKNHFREYGEKLHADLSLLPDAMHSRVEEFIHANPIIEVALTDAVIERRNREKNLTENSPEPHRARKTKSKFKELTADEVTQVLVRGKTHAWSTRTERGHPYQADVFEYILDTYGRWLPGLTQELLGRADPSIMSYFKKRKSEAGLPDWLYIPTRKEVSDLLETDPKRAAWREMERARHRQRRAALRQAKIS
jgi:hypothetical protein